MPPKNRIKFYAEDAFYHAYNRGYNHQEIFRDEEDYFTFIHLFKRYLEPGFQEIRLNRKKELQPFTPNFAYEDVELIAYCLMPNHFHLLVRQKTLQGMPKLLIRLCSNYATFFNDKYQYEGSPFQGTYRAVTITSEEQLLHVSRYIHLNPSALLGRRNLGEYPYSSFPFYVSGKPPLWLKNDWVLSYFLNKPQGYQSFVESFLDQSVEKKNEELETIKGLGLD